MVVWTAQNAPKMQDVASALDNASVASGAAASGGSVASVFSACQGLRSVVTTFQAAALPAPDAQLNDELTQVMDGLRQGADDCLAGRFEATAADVTQALLHLQAANDRLIALAGSGVR